MPPGETNATTPEQMLAEMETVFDNPNDGNAVIPHIESDVLMERVLIELGYGEAIDFLRKQTRNYT